MQSRDGDVVTIRPGDIIHTPSDEWHWHGATPDDLMTHLSITEGTGDSGRPETEWGPHVTDAEYPWRGALGAGAGSTGAREAATRRVVVFAATAP